MKNKEFSAWHVEVAAEALCASLFARLGFDVSVQYGANQPEYDLIIAKGASLLKVSVKGSQDGAWGLAQSFITKGLADYQEAIEKWLAKHKEKTIFCFVQFQNVQIEQMPRVYLASPEEVAIRLRQASKNKGDTILFENKVWTPRAHGYPTTEVIPENWKFTKERVMELIVKYEHYAKT